MPNPSKHECSAKGCVRSISKRLLMCREHWMLVPKSVQNKIWQTYCDGQEDRVGTDRGPSIQYIDAYIEAVNAVFQAEAKP
jgi:hypothetical protein